MSQELTILICTLFGSVVGAWIGAYIQGRATEKGRIAAVTTAFNALLNQYEERAKAEERGKRLATHEDVENVLSEVRLVTRETEKIKVDVSSTKQTEQRFWEETRNLYIRLLEWTYRHIRVVNDAKLSPSDEMWHRVGNSHEELLHLGSLMVVFGSLNLWKVWDHFGKDETADVPRTSQWCDAEIARVNRLASGVSALARRELWGSAHDIEFKK